MGRSRIYGRYTRGARTWCRREGRERLGDHCLSFACAVVSCFALAACGPATSTSAPAATSSGQPAQPGQSPAPPAAITYVALGASDAFGVGTDRPAEQCWPSVLASQLGASVHLINLGIPGATVDEALSDELPIALTLHPTFMTVLLGTNDLIDGVPSSTTIRGMQRLFSSLRAGTTATIYVGNLPDLTLLPYFADQNHAKLSVRIVAFNAALAVLGAEFGIIIVNLYSAWGDLTAHPEYISADGLHPSAAGAARIAQLFAAAIHSQQSQSA